MAVPNAMQEKYDETAAFITDFCDKKLNDEFKEICLRLLEKLCRKRPSPLLSGKSRTWAAGIVYAIGQNNFIFDPAQDYHMSADEIAAPFGIKAATAGNKAAEIRKYVDITHMDPEWLLKEIIDEGPLSWLLGLGTGNFKAGSPSASQGLPRILSADGLIPFLSREDDETEDDRPKKKAKKDTPQKSFEGIKVSPGQAFKFRIEIDFYGDDLEVWRNVTVPVNITFRQLHSVIQSSLNWHGSHMFDFQIYDNSEEGELLAVVTDNDEDFRSDDEDEKVKTYPLSAKLTKFIPKYQRILYIYDYGDDWMHRCELVDIIDNYKEDYPICTEGKGDAPPEDAGGEGGYADFLDAIKDKSNPDHAEMKEWGKSQGFERFNLKKVNERLKNCLKIRRI